MSSLPPSAVRHLSDSSIFTHTPQGGVGKEAEVTELGFTKEETQA